MKRIFVAGAGGYVGMVLCPMLVKAGYRVTAFDRYFFGKIPEGCEMVVGDIRTVRHRTLDYHDAVVDLAGLSNDASCEIDPAYTQSINAMGGITLAKVAKACGIKRYIYSSSASVYGHGIKESLTEKDELNPQTAYAASKVEVEDKLREMTTSEFAPVILRNATMFGVSPRMRFDLAVNIMTLRAKQSGLIYVMGGGEQWRPFVHVADAASTIMWAIEVEDSVVCGQTFNVGCNKEQFTIAKLATMVAPYFANIQILTIPDGPDNRSYHLSFNKLEAIKSVKSFRGVHYGIGEVLKSITDGSISGDDPTAYTVQWYKSMLEWDARLTIMKGGGPIL